MTIKDLLLDVPQGQWMMLKNCPGVHHVMTGIARAGIRSDAVIKVQFCDFTEIEKPASERFLTLDDSELNLFSFASEITP